MAPLKSIVAYGLSLLQLTAAAKGPNVAVTIPDAYIVEFADDHSTDSFYSSLGASGQAVDHRLDLNYNLFKGVSFQLKNVTSKDDVAKKIEAMPAVKQMWPVRAFPLPNDEVIWTGTTETTAEQASASLKRRQDAGNDTFSPHVMTQVDLLRAEGIIGTGIKVAVVDTGVDYRHPALGGCFGEGCLVAFGTDLVGDDYNGFNTPVPDPDPLDTCEGHGTHVSGIIAAQNNSYGFTGAAPGVTLGMYRVFGCYDNAGNDVLIAAFNQAYEDGADIITASIGGPSGWSEDPWAVAVERIVEAGVPCTVSAGNDGAEGLWYASSAADGKQVTAVASVDNTQSPAILLSATYTVNNGTPEEFGWSAGTPPFPDVHLPLWAVSFDTTDPANGCDPYPADTPDLSGYIVLVRRGTCTFVQKATNAAEFGAHYVMLYNNVAGVSSPAADVPGIDGIGMVSAAQGAEWISFLAANSTVVLNITNPDDSEQFATTVTNNRTGGFLSTYTSWGPTFELDFYPDVSAPGGNILSTYPLDLGAYAVLSGTSMACPITAAIIALIGEVRGTLEPTVIENVLTTNANPNLFNDGATTYPYLAPVSQQGSGLVQAYDAAYATTLVSVNSVAFNDSDHFVGEANFTISNTGSEEVTYQLSNVGAATTYTFYGNETVYPDVFPNELTATYASIDFGYEKTVSIAAGGEATVEFTLTPPAVPASRLPVYSGYIAINGSDGTSLSVPYTGVVGSMYDQTVLDADNTYLSVSTSADYLPVAANTTFILPANNASATNATRYPVVVAYMPFGSAQLRMDVSPIGPPSYNSNVTTVLGVKTLGNIYSFPHYYLPRGALTGEFDGLLEDGTLAPAGTYTIVVRALRIFGDPTIAEDWMVAKTVPFTIRYA